MGAVFGAASRATFAFIIFAFELTRDYNSVLPLMLVCVIADGIGMMFMKTSIMTEKLARRGLRINQDYEADVLMEVNVGDVMDRDLPAVPSTMQVRELAERIARREPQFVRHQAFLVLSEQGDLEAIVTRGDILRSLETDPSGNASVLKAGTSDLLVTTPDEMLYDAAGKMLRADIGRLPVVSPDNPKKAIGYLGRAGVLSARLKRMHEESHRDTGWWTRWRGAPSPTKTV
jgi:CBS domain-containing protein